MGPRPYLPAPPAHVVQVAHTWRRPPIGLAAPGRGSRGQGVGGAGSADCGRGRAGPGRDGERSAQRRPGSPGGPDGNPPPSPPTRRPVPRRASRSSRCREGAPAPAGTRCGRAARSPGLSRPAPPRRQHRESRAGSGRLLQLLPPPCFERRLPEPAAFYCIPSRCRRERSSSSRAAEQRRCCSL